MQVQMEKKGNICTVIINRPEVCNAVDRPTADQLVEAFEAFDHDDRLAVAILWGAGGHFCAGADLKVVSGMSKHRVNRLEEDMSKPGPMGPSRMLLSKPVIAAVSGYAVAGGMELACWCDLRVVEETATFGVFCRRFGVPLIDGGTQRLPRLIGISRALDMILTGRPVCAQEAMSMGLANRIVPHGTAREEAEKLAAQIAAFPQICIRNDRKAVYRGYDLPFNDAMAVEFHLGLEVIRSGETVAGAEKFSGGQGRHGKF